MKKYNHKNKRGQTLVEYALIIAFISVVAASLMWRLGMETVFTFQTIDSQLVQAQSSH